MTYFKKIRVLKQSYKSGSSSKASNAFRSKSISSPFSHSESLPESQSCWVSTEYFDFKTAMSASVALKIALLRNTNHVSTHEKKKQRDQHREHNCNRPLTLIIIINIFEYLALSTTLYPLTSIIPYKKRLSSLQNSVFYKSYFKINLKISRIRPPFQNFCGDLISRLSEEPIFRGIKFRGNSQIWPKNAKSAKFNPNKVTLFAISLVPTWTIKSSGFPLIRSSN